MADVRSPLPRASGLVGAAGSQVARVHSSMTLCLQPAGTGTGTGTGRCWREGTSPRDLGRPVELALGPPATSCVVSRPPSSLRPGLWTAWALGPGPRAPARCRPRVSRSSAWSLPGLRDLGVWGELVFHPLVAQPSAKCYREGRRHPL